MKKIVIFALKGPESDGISGGFEVYEEEFAKALELIDYEIEIYCGRDKDEEHLPSFEQISNNITVRRFNSPFNFLPFSIFPMHFYHLRKGRKTTDYVVENQSVLTLFTPLYKNSALTIIHHLTGKDFIRKQGFFKGMIGIFCERIVLPILYRKQNILTVSEHTKEEIIENGFKSNQVKVIPPIVRTEGTNYSYNSNRNNIVSYIGRYTGKGGNKRIDDVIKVFPKVLDRVSDAKLIIGGSMKKIDELMDLVNENDLVDKVEFKGFLNDEKKRELLANSKVFASPSYQEGFGITYIEAHSYGTPVVGYEIPGLDTVPKNSGFMVEKDNLNELTDAIVTLLTEDKQWEEFSRNSQKNAQRYSAEKIQQEIQEYVQKILT